MVTELSLINMRTKVCQECVQAKQYKGNFSKNMMQNQVSS